MNADHMKINIELNEEKTISAAKISKEKLNDAKTLSCHYHTVPEKWIKSSGTFNNNCPKCMIKKNYLGQSVGNRQEVNPTYFQSITVR